ncbi:MAG: hypothetical protein R2911_24230 [Caldilineaceae bacterium]
MTDWRQAMPWRLNLILNPPMPARVYPICRIGIAAVVYEGGVFGRL